MARRRPAPVSTAPPAGAVSPTIEVLVRAGAGKPPAASLPKGTRVLPVAPKLPASLDTPEADYLRRSYQVVLPHGADVAEAVARLRATEVVEKASPGPQLELPK
jgi:hypothetical protein